MAKYLQLRLNDPAHKSFGSDSKNKIPSSKILNIPFIYSKDRLLHMVLAFISAP